MPASKRVGLTGNPAPARFQFRTRNHWTGGGRNRTTIKGFCSVGQEDAAAAYEFGRTARRRGKVVVQVERS